MGFEFMNSTAAMMHRRLISNAGDQPSVQSDELDFVDTIWPAPIAIVEPAASAEITQSAVTTPAPALAAMPPVEATHAQEVADVSIAVVSNDFFYSNNMLWGMLGDTGPLQNAFGSQANEAWAEGATGSTSSVVGVIDTGIDYTHPDLYLNIWLNQREIPTTLREIGRAHV